LLFAGAEEAWGYSHPRGRENRAGTAHGALKKK
jgi:hypothetical protein